MSGHQSTVATLQATSTRTENIRADRLTAQLTCALLAVAGPGQTAVNHQSLRRPLRHHCDRSTRTVTWHLNSLRPSSGHIAYTHSRTTPADGAAGARPAVPRQRGRFSAAVMPPRLSSLIVRTAAGAAPQPAPSLRVPAAPQQPRCRPDGVAAGAGVHRHACAAGPAWPRGERLITPPSACQRVWFANYNIHKAAEG